MSNSYKASAVQTTASEMASIASWATFTKGWIDYLYLTNGATGNDDDRYFMGHETFDCYQQSGVRCFKGAYKPGAGNTNGYYNNYKRYTNCEVFLAVSV